jgi:hypothetical protein
MTDIKLIQLNVCNDDDLIYGSDSLSKSDIDNFISYHKIIDKNLIEDLNKLYLTFATSSNLSNKILSYHISDNKLRSITVKLNERIHYINNLKPEVVDSFIKNKKKKLFDEIEKSNADFVLLQEFDTHYLPVNSDKYEHISPLYQDEKCNIEYLGMLSNHILYKKSNNYELLRVYIADYGLVAEFVIKSKIIKIVSGRWYPLKENKDKRLMQYNSLNREIGTIIFMGDTNLRSFENISEKDKKNIEDVATNEIFMKSYTINKNINAYFNDGLKFVARYDRAYVTSQVKVKKFDLFFNQPYDELKNEYRSSGYISDHFGLILDATI